MEVDDSAEPMTRLKMTEFLDSALWLWYPWNMAEPVRRLRDPFRSTLDDERQEIIDAILSGTLDYDSPSDEDLIFLADQRFLELDREENED